MKQVGAGLLILLAIGVIAWALWTPRPPPVPRPPATRGYGPPPTYPYPSRRPTATPTRSLYP